MNIRNGIESLTQIPATQSPQSVAAPKTTASTSNAPTDTAQVSAVATQVVQSSADSDVRLDKVAGIQAALASGTYQVPASAVAQKVIGALLSTDK